MSQMQNDKFIRQLRLLATLVGNNQMTKAEMMEQFGLPRRTFYRYLEDYRELDFIVEETRKTVRVEPFSPFIRNLAQHFLLNQTELNTIHELLEDADDKLINIRNLKDKFRSAYGMEFTSDAQGDRIFAYNSEQLRRAIARKCKVVLPSYSSPHSQTMSDRIVEPFKFLLNGLEIRCYEDASGKCKTFKIARIQDKVRLLDAPWTNEAQHRDFFTDLWGFSGEDTTRVKLRLGYLSKRLLMEEYNVADYRFVIDDDKHWLFSTQVCSFQGIGRFYMGLCNDIEIVDSPDFQRYIDGVLQNLTQSCQNE